MGLFDTIINSYKPLGEEFLNKELQTKDLDNTMSRYWISPAGELFAIEVGEAFQLVPEKRFPRPLPFRWEATGKNQKLSPVDHTGQLRVYPAEYSALSPSCYRRWPEAILLLKHGKIIYHELTHIKSNEPN